MKKVPVGITTIVGVILGVLPGLIAIAAKALQEGSAITVNGPERWLAILTIVTGALVLVGRYLQAAIAAKQTEEFKLVPKPPTQSETLKTTPLAFARELLAENPEVVQQLKDEGVIV